jgi:hypothetical protein
MHQNGYGSQPDQYLGFDAKTLLVVVMCIPDLQGKMIGIDPY